MADGGQRQAAAVGPDSPLSLLSSVRLSFAPVSPSSPSQQQLQPHTRSPSHEESPPVPHLRPVLLDGCLSEVAGRGGVGGTPANTPATRSHTHNLESSSPFSVRVQTSSNGWQQPASNPKRHASKEVVVGEDVELGGVEIALAPPPQLARRPSTPLMPLLPPLPLPPRPPESLRLSSLLLVVKDVLLCLAKLVIFYFYVFSLWPLNELAKNPFQGVSGVADFFGGSSVGFTVMVYGEFVVLNFFLLLLFPSTCSDTPTTN